MKNLLSLVLASRLFRWLSYGIGALLLLMLVAWLSLPTYLKNTIEQQALTQTGRKLSVEQVSFNPFTLTADVRKLVLFEADKTTPAFSAEALRLRVSLASVFRLAPVISEVILDTPYLHLTHSKVGDRDLTNFSDIIDKLAAQPSSGSPVRYSVSNIQLHNGRILVDDQVSGEHIRLESLNVGVPFISSFPGAADVFIEPSLSAILNDAPIALKARSKPFSGSKETSLAIDINKLNLAQFDGFLPKSIPVKLRTATFSSQLDLSFLNAKDAPEISLSGKASLNDLALEDHAAAPLLKVQAISADITKLNVLSGSADLHSLEISEPQVWAALDQRGKLNWQTLQSAPTPASSNKNSSPAPVFKLDQVQIKNGIVHWSDEKNATPRIALELNDIAADIKNLSSASNAKPAELSLSMGEKDKQNLKFAGSLEPLNAVLNGKLDLNQLALAEYQPYFNPGLLANVSGTAALQTGIDFRDGKLKLDALSASLDNLNVLAKTKALGGVAVKKIAVENVAMDLSAQRLQIPLLQIDSVRGDVTRDEQGVINFSKFLNSNQAKTARAPAHAPASSPWLVTVAKVNLTDSAIGYTDQSVKPAIAVRTDALTIQLEDVTSKMDKPAKVTMHARINKQGKISVQGTAQANAAKLALDVQSFPVTMLQPYFTEFLNITLVKGSASSKGQLQWQAPAVIKYDGSVQLTDFRALDKETSDDFLIWKMLDFKGIKVDLGAAQQHVTLGKIALNNFYARAILSEQGKLNLQEVVIRKAPEQAATAQAASAPTASVTASTASVAAATPPAASANVAAPVIEIGQITLTDGTINYTDNFIQPHYSVKMTTMNGSIGKVASNVAQPAPIDLSGKIDSSAPVAISGSLNPLFKPMFLDIKTSANGIDLPGLTTYSAKYAGYPIEKGKLSMDVHYHVENDQLTAQNSVKIDQLTFGDKVDNPTATKLPVLLVVDLLKDSNGQINLDLPISGTISDPEFSIGGVIFRVFINLIGKVITSPFALLGHSFSGGEELAYIEFDSGSSRLTDATKEKLQKIASALESKPSLKLDITGRSDEKADDQGLRAAMLRRQIAKIVNAKANDDTSSATISDQDRAKAIDKIYSAAKFDKPRNAIGFAKSLPTAEMEKLILVNTKLTADDFRDLAVKRANAARQFLEDSGHVTAEHMFLIAPKLNGDGITDKGSISRVDFGLKR